MHDDYFEGILQLRNPTEEVYKFLANQFRDHPKYWIAKKGELKLSKKLFSQDRLTSKMVYRGTVLFRLPEEST